VSCPGRSTAGHSPELSAATAMLKFVLSSTAFAAALSAIALMQGCSSVPPATLAVIAARDTITVAQFEDTYTRMRRKAPETDAQKEDFLRLLIDNRVKLHEARALGLEADKELSDETAEYRDQLAMSYYIDQKLVTPAVRTLAERRKDEVRFSHIITRWRRYGGDVIDTLATYREAEKTLLMALEGKEPFDSLVARYSEDPLKVKNGGSIGWFIGGTTLPQVDDIVYTMKVGEVYPHLMKTTFGYHVIKLTGRHPARLRLHAWQILDRLDINNPSDTSASFARMSLILDSLRSGKASFEDLARRNSQDPVSGEKGGDLGWANRGVGLEQHFEEALFNLPVGQTSSVVRSAFGMHIIRVTEEEPAPPEAELDADLRDIYKRERLEGDARFLLTELKRKYEFTINRKVVNLIVSHTEPTWTTSTPNWHSRLTPKDKEAYLFTLKNRNVSIAEAITAIARDPYMQMRSFTTEGLDSIAIALADKYALIEETKGLEVREPAFGTMLREYRESVLVSRLEQDQVWSKVAVSDEALRGYWERHKAEYRLPDRVSFSEIYVFSEKQGNQLIDSLKAGASFAALASRYTKRTGMFDKGGSWGFQPVHRDELSEAANKLVVGEVSAPMKNPPGYSVIRCDAKDPARTKTFEEARNEVAAKVKEQAIASRTREWVGELRAKYAVQSWPGNLRNAFAPAAGK
jgi:parvulin-like peptidyl-prolyl isomerase